MALAPREAYMVSPKSIIISKSEDQAGAGLHFRDQDHVAGRIFPGRFSSNTISE